MLAMVAALTAGRPVGVPAPVRTRLESPNADQLPALTVYQGREIVSPMHEPVDGRKTRGVVVRRALDVNVEVLAIAEAGAATPADAAADPTMAWVVKSLAAAGTFSGLAHDAPDEVGTVFAYEAKEVSFVRAIMTFRIEFSTLTVDAEALK
jgi:hypothetical protein